MTHFCLYHLPLSDTEPNSSAKAGLRRIVKTFRYVKTYRCRDEVGKITSSKSLVSQAQWLIQRVWRIILRLAMNFFLTILISLETQKTNGEIDNKSIEVQAYL